MCIQLHYINHSGFGLEHEAISEGDVVVFAPLVLVAFVFLSSFLNKLAEFVQNFGCGKERDEGDDNSQSIPSFEEILRDTPICSFGGRRTNGNNTNLNDDGTGIKQKEANSSTGAFLLLAWLFGGLKLDSVPNADRSCDGSPNSVR